MMLKLAVAGDDPRGLIVRSIFRYVQMSPLLIFTGINLIHLHFKTMEREERTLSFSSQIMEPEGRVLFFHSRLLEALLPAA
jgi:hypothetical protein